LLVCPIATDSVKLFDRYAPLIRSLPEVPCFEKSTLCVSDFCLHREDCLEIYYAPFDYINRAAKIMLLGITPGYTQMEIGYRQARSALVAGLSMDEVCRAAKKSARVLRDLCVGISLE
jgi:hypothetical protein